MRRNNDGGSVAFSGKSPNRPREMASADNIVFANDNAPSQIVVSGDKATLRKFSELVAHGKQGTCCHASDCRTVAQPLHAVRSGAF